MSNLSNIFIGFLVHEKAYGYISKPSPFEGIDMVMYTIDPEHPGMVHYHSKTDPISKYLIEKELWKIAYCNTIGGTKIVNFMGMLTITNNDNFLGASCVLNIDALKECMALYETTKIAIIPSSIHEVIPFPYEDKNDIVALSQMVIEINSNPEIINPLDTLGNKAYLVDLSKIEEVTSIFRS